MVVTRRDLLNQIGHAGGYGAAFVAMQGLGMIPTSSQAAPVSLPKGGGKGVKVVILGGGVTGLSAAYEMGKAGYDCTILEARDRIGGRNFTVRRGDKIEMTGLATQVCGFDEGQYFNAGPSRIASHHQAVLDYCRELAIPMEVQVTTTRSAYLWNNTVPGQKPIQMRQVINDGRGHVSELLAKAINIGALDKELTPHDKERMVAFLKDYGDLSPDLFYKGSDRSGYTVAPGAGDIVGSHRDPLTMAALLDADMWKAALLEDLIHLQATMHQPVGGMDQIPAAFAKRLGSVVVKNAEVTEIRRAGNGVNIVYRDTKSGKLKSAAADYCICTLPLTILRSIPSDFSPEVKTAIAEVQYGDAVRVAWQSPRFWETQNQIYGGISYVKGPTTMLWYPSERMHSEKGVIVTAYAFGPNADIMSATPHDALLEMTRTVVEGIHPGQGSSLAHPLSISWLKVPYNLGSAPRWKGDQDENYILLNKPDGPFYFAGEHLAHVGAWLESAFLSAQRTVKAIDDHRSASGKL